MKIYVDVENFNDFIQDISGYSDEITPITMFECMVEDIDDIAMVVHKYLSDEQPDYAPSRLLQYLASQAKGHAGDSKHQDRIEILAVFCKKIMIPTIRAIFNVIDFYNYEFSYVRHEFGSDDDGTALLILEATEEGKLPSIEGDDVTKLATRAYSVMCGDM